MAQVRLRNASGRTSKVGQQVKLAPKSKTSFINAELGDSGIIGTVAQSAPNGYSCLINLLGHNATIEITPVLVNTIIEKISPLLTEVNPNQSTSTDGKSAYQVALDSGYTGTVAEWLLSLKGEDGADGTYGTQGEQGETGTNGTNGSDASVTKENVEAVLTGEVTSHTHPAGAGGGMNLLRTTATQTINAGAGVFADITELTFPVVNGVDYAFYFYITFRSAATTTGWRAGVNCPTGTLDFWATSDIIANGAAGVATHTERHNTVRDDMTLLTATITQAVDLSIEIRGRYLCTQNGTFACRFANELAANTQIVVQKGSWGWWF